MSHEKCMSCVKNRNIKSQKHPEKQEEKSGSKEREKHTRIKY